MWRLVVAGVVMPCAVTSYEVGRVTSPFFDLFVTLTTGVLHSCSVVSVVARLLGRWQEKPFSIQGSGWRRRPTS